MGTAHVFIDFDFVSQIIGVNKLQAAADLRIALGGNDMVRTSQLEYRRTMGVGFHSLIFPISDVFLPLSL